MQLVRAQTRKQLRDVRRLYRTAFPRTERKPFSLMLKKQKTGDMEIFRIERDNGAFLGLAITVLYGDIVLLDYFAVSPETRGQGVGSAALSLITAHCGTRRLILEIERTDVPAENPEQRQRRKAFYLRAGMHLEPWHVRLFGVEMELLTKNGSVSYNEYRALYCHVFSARAGDFIRLLPENDAP